MGLSTTVASPDQHLESALAEYEIAYEQGNPPGRATFLARHPAIAEELAHCLDAYTVLDNFTRPICAALDGRPPVQVPQLADYEILDELGRGAMGVVYLSRQKGTNQLVALKMLNPDWIERLDSASRDHAIELLRVEAQAAARLKHPCTVPILHMGEYQGCPFFAMQLIEGPTLAARLRREPTGRLNNHDAALYLASVSEAVHEAHQHGVLHRDLKPGNILIDERSNLPRVADFGLAKLEPEPSSQPATAEISVRQQRCVLGTLPYMSPEQVLDSDAVTVASDIYSLGATLYELLTGRPPFWGSGRAEVIRKIQGERPVPPSQLNSAVSTRLEQIVLRCLEKEPRKRYASAAELSQALRSYLAEAQGAWALAAMGNLFMVLGVVVICINTFVYTLFQGNLWEPLVWLCMFSIYPAMFAVLLLAPRSRADINSHPTRQEMWSIWGAKLFAAATLALVLRLAFPSEPRQAMLLCYPVYAALSGMAVFIMAMRIWRHLYALAVLGWGLAVLMMFCLDWAPLIYGVYAGTGCVLFGMYERRMGRELR